ncbi:MAG: MFS transporter [Armatimonadota bacterium]
MEGNTSRQNNRFNVNEVFRALKSRNYRLFFFGQLISLVGTWIQSVALSWLVYSLTGSAVLLGIVGFTSQIATFLLTPFAGVLVDRWNRHRMIIMTQTMFMIQALLLAFLVLAGKIQVWQIIALGTFAGFVNGFDIPTRQSFVIEMVENREDLPNAIALNSSMFNAARLVGPALAGALIAAVGEGMCFLINGISYIAVIIALFFMRVAVDTREREHPHPVTQLREGFAYTFGFPPIRSIIYLLALISLVSMPYAVLMPVFATKILHGGPATLGILTSATGVGALVGAIFLASRKSVLGLGKWIPFSAFMLGAALIAFSFSGTLWLSISILIIIGFVALTQMASSNTILQTIVEDAKRGRVMSFYTMAFMGMAPFGSLMAGTLAESIGAPRTVAIGGFIAIVGAIVFASNLPRLRELVRPVYCEKGILPVQICGVEKVTEDTVPPEQR